MADKPDFILFYRTLVCLHVLISICISLSQISINKLQAMIEPRGKLTYLLLSMIVKGIDYYHYHHHHGNA